MDLENNEVAIDISYNSYNFIKNYHTDKISCLSRVFGLKSEIDKNLEKIIKLVYKNVNLDEREKEILLIRYIEIYKKIENKYKKNSRFYTFTSLFTGISSILVTAFISLNNLKETNSSMSTTIWWLAWSLSLGISLVNTIGAFYKWDRKFLLMFKVYYKIEQELWMYLELVGPYSHKCNQQDISQEYKTKMPLFMARLELIYKKVNENLLDIEDQDQDDKDNLRNQKIITEQGDTSSEMNNFIKSKINNNEKITEKYSEVLDKVNDDLENSQENEKIYLKNKKKIKISNNSYEENRIINKDISEESKDNKDNKENIIIKEEKKESKTDENKNIEKNDIFINIKKNDDSISANL